MKKSILCIILISVFIFAAFSFSSFAGDEITLEEGKEIFQRANDFYRDLTTVSLLHDSSVFADNSRCVIVFNPDDTLYPYEHYYNYINEAEKYQTIESLVECSKTIFTDDIAQRAVPPFATSTSRLTVMNGKIYGDYNNTRFAFVPSDPFLDQVSRIEQTESGARLYINKGINSGIYAGETYFDLVRTEDGVKISGGDAFEFLYSQNKYAFRLAKEGDEVLLSSAASELLSHKNGIASSSLKDGVLSFKTTSGEDLSITLSDAAVLEDGGDDATIVFSVVWNRSHEGLSSTTEDNIDACLKGNCNTVELKKVNGEWKVVGGTIFNEGIIYSSNPFAPATGDGSAIFVILAAMSIIAFVSLSAFSVKRRYN